MKRSRSMSVMTFSTGWPVCLARISAMRRVIASTSWAWISMSAGVPRKPAEPWWIITLEFGSARRLPAAPPPRIIAAADMPMPMHTVATSGLTYCIVS